MKRVVFTVAPMTIILVGCPPVTLKTITLSPTEVDAGYQSQYSQNAYCDFPLPGQGMFLNGLGPETLASGEVDSGWEDVFDTGPQPFPCQEEQQTQYRGHVVFDMSKFDAITDATLRFNVDKSETTTGGLSPMIAVSAATVLGMSTGTRNDGNGPYFWDYDNDVTLPTCTTSLIKPDCSIDVSVQARMWNNQDHFNYGFILAGPAFGFPDDLPQDNNAVWSAYSGFQLVVTYNPALNPRAPQ